MTVLAVLTGLAVLESTLPSFYLSYKIQHNEATLTVLKGPKIENFQDRPPGLKFSSEIENSSKPPTKPLFFAWGNLNLRD